jgi:hypothetical protein
MEMIIFFMYHRSYDLGAGRRAMQETKENVKAIRYIKATCLLPDRTLCSDPNRPASSTRTSGRHSLPTEKTEQVSFLPDAILPLLTSTMMSTDRARHRADSNALVADRKKYLQHS